MFSGVKSSFGIIGASIRVMARYPSLLIPVLVVWAVYAPVSVYMYFDFPKLDLSDGALAGVVFGLIFAFSILMSFTCFMLLEQIRRIESGLEPSLPRAVWSALTNTLRAIHITALWALVWFVLFLLERIFSRRGDSESGDSEPEPFSMQGAAEVVAGYERVSLSEAFFRAVRKGVRMVTFLIYPAIAWEPHRRGLKRGIEVAVARKAEFAVGFVLTELAATVAFIPALIVFWISGEFEADFPDWVWMSTIIYCGFAWSFSLLLEQMFAAELYLWHWKWEIQAEEAVAAGASPPLFSDVPSPSLLDDLPDMPKLSEN